MVFEILGIFMLNYLCFVIYYLLFNGLLVDFGVLWLGWNVEIGIVVVYFDLLLDVVVIMEILCKYGLYGMLKLFFCLNIGLI